MLRGCETSSDGTTGMAVESTRRATEIPLPIKLARTRTLYSFPHREATACLGRGQG